MTIFSSIRSSVPQDAHVSQIQVIVIESEKETGGFLAPSITILAREGWKGNTTLEKCQKRLSKLSFCLGQKLLKTPLKNLSKKD